MLVASQVAPMKLKFSTDDKPQVRDAVRARYVASGEAPRHHLASYAHNTPASGDSVVLISPQAPF